MCHHLGVEPSGSPEDLVRAARRHGVCDERVLAAVGGVRRETFLTDEWRSLAYIDLGLPIPCGQVTQQPSLAAQMVESLRLTGEERVLEVGTGLGYQTALLAAVTREVYSIERFRRLARLAREALRTAGVRNAAVVVGDGTRGLARFIPFDAVVVSAAAPEVPAALVEQLAAGGRLIQPIGRGDYCHVTGFVKSGERLEEVSDLVPAKFVPLVRRRIGFRRWSSCRDAASE